MFVVNNQGVYGGGLRSGHPALVAERNNNPNILQHVSCESDRIAIHHNHITQNGGLGGAGGGLSLYTGTDFYDVMDNHICGNFTQGDGGGIGHLGLSLNGLILDNEIYFNQSFNQ